MKPIVYFIIISPCLVFSQDFKAVYYRPVKDASEALNTEAVQMSTLYFNASRSLFVLHENGKSSSFDEELGRANIELGNEEMWFFKDFKENSLISQQSVMGDKKYIIYDQLHPMRWNLTHDTKKIGKFTCEKAVCRFRGRQYEAWFTRDIPVHNGPWKLGGLPGLILEVFDNEKLVVFLFRSVGVIGEENYRIIKPIETGQVVSLQEFYEIGRQSFENYFKFLKARTSKNHPNVEIALEEYRPWEILHK